MKSYPVGSWLRLIPALWFCQALLASGANPPVVMFGLTNKPIGSAALEVRGNDLLVRGYATEGLGGLGGTRHTGPLLGLEGAYGVSIPLGHADAGLFVYPYTYGEPYQGSFLVGKAFGQLDGQENQLISVLAAAKQDYGIYWALVDFSAIGAYQLRYELYEGDRLVSAITNAIDSIAIYTQSEYSPRGNPFWRLPDGGIAAVIEFTGVSGVRFPGQSEEFPTPAGDRIVVRPLDAQGEVGYISRVEVTAGGSLNEFVVSDERMGMFQHAHKALGHSLLNASPGQLTITSLAPTSGGEMGVLMELEEPRSFAVDLAPLALSSNGAAIVAGAVGSLEHTGSEFLGYIGVRQTNGQREVFGDLTFFAAGVSLSVYRDGCQSGATDSPTLMPTIGVAGSPRVVGFSATADTGNRRPGWSVRFESATTFSLPDGTQMTGDELRFRATGPVAVNRLLAFSLLGSNLPAIHILGESGAEVISLGDYLPELTSAASIRLIKGTVNGNSVSFRQSATPTQRGGVPFVLLSDTLPPAASRTSLFAWRDDALWFHGGDSTTLGLFSSTGVRLLPARPSSGQSYSSAGSFLWHNPASGIDTPVQVTATTRAAGFERVNAPAGSFYAFRLETSLVFAPSAETNAPRAWHTTNWLAYGVGIIALTEAEHTADGSVRRREAGVAYYNLITSVPLAPVLNVGATTVLTASAISESGGPDLFRWHKDGVALSAGSSAELLIIHAQFSDAGVYSVVSSNLAGEISAPIATLRVTPFEESSQFLAWRGSGTGFIAGPWVVGDHAGNVYYAGALRGALEFETNLISDDGLNRALFVTKFDSAGHLQWVRTADGGGDASLQNLAVDDAGDLYLYGNYTGSQFILGPFTLTEPGQGNVFAAKLSADGDWLWAVSPTISQVTGASRAAVDGAGNQLITGVFFGTAKFGTNELVDLDGESSFFLVKFDRDGNVVWATKSSMPGEYVNMSVDDVKADGTGGFYLSGVFTDRVTLGGLQLTAGTNNYQGFLARLDGDGHGVWAKTQLNSVEMGVADDGSLYVLGYFNGLLDLGGAILTGSNYRWSLDRYLARLRPDGSAVWGRKLPFAYYFTNPGLIVDAAGSVYLASSGFGRFAIGETTFGGSGDFGSLLLKYNAEGRRVWAKQLTGLNGGPSIYSFARDGLGNIVLAGGFSVSVNLGPTNFVAGGGNNPFFVTMRPAVPPAFNQQPQSSTVNPGQSVTFTAVATGTAPFEFQWRRNGVDLAGATNASLTLASVQAGDAGFYSLVVRNGGGQAFSRPAVLQVNLPSAGIVAFSAANFSVSEGAGHADITLARTGDTSRPATVTIETADGSAKAASDYAALMAVLTFGPGESTKAFELPVIQDGFYELAETLQLRLCNASGGATLGVPAITTLTITDDDPPAPVILSQPRSRIIGDGTTVSFTVTANGEAPLQYEWRKGGFPVTGATSQTFTLAPVHMADAGTYSVRVYNSAGQAISDDVTLTVLPLPQILTHPQSQSIPYGETASFSASATSSIPVVTLPFARMGTGPAIDRFQISNSVRRGVIEIRADFGIEVDSLTLFVGRIPVAGTGFVLDRTTNLVAFDYPYPPPIEIVINREGEGAGADAWSYEGEIVSIPLRYRWRKDAEELPYAFGPQLFIAPATMVHTGQYDVVVSDAVGAVTSQPATLTLTPPVLHIEHLTINPPQVRLWWSSPDHLVQRTTELFNGTWEWIGYPYSGTILEATNRQEYFRLKFSERPPPGAD